MNCRNCGATIADKAIVCYRCGTATTDAKFKAPLPRRPRSSINLVSSVLAVALLVLFALYMQRFASLGTPGALRWLIAAVAVAIVALRAIARRAKR